MKMYIIVIATRKTATDFNRLIIKGEFYSYLWEDHGEEMG
jgi:hypothetical protein